MAAYLLDTNHASPLVTLNHPLRTQVRDALRKGSNFAICVPVLTETLFGIGVLPRAGQNQAEWRVWQSMFVCYVPDETDAVVAANLQIRLRRKGRQLTTIDATIATIALRHQLILLTTDQDYQYVDRLETQNWLEV
jgi:predicted nucleic acid-binding protein